LNALETATAAGEGDAGDGVAVSPAFESWLHPAKVRHAASAAKKLTRALDPFKLVSDLIVSLANSLEKRALR
jgi:hypothetical protein